ncbi:MAG: hypothetical protein HGA54_00450 [Actinobacteria bacterium]|nr:hypothetical protein [Actinomycetota bacterium]
MKPIESFQPLLVFQTQQEWHDWLHENHRRESEVWLEIAKAKSPRRGISLSEAVTEAIRYGWIDSKMRSVDEDSFILRFSPRRPKSVWSKINRQRAEGLIAEGQMSEAGLEAVREGKESGQWQSAYTAKERPVVPLDLEEALSSDSKAEINFETWSNSEQLQAVAWVEQSKSQITRQKRIDKIVDCTHSDKKLWD